MRTQKQTDTLWARQPIGDSIYKVGTHGCTLTSLSNIADITPLEAERRLKFTKDGLVIWSSVANIGLEFIWRGKPYDDAEVKKAIKDYGFCLVEVDFDGSPRTIGNHWFIALGNGKIIDPLGLSSDFNFYDKTDTQLRGYCIIKKSVPSNQTGETNMQDYRGYNLDDKESMKAAVDVVIRAQEGDLVDKSVILQANEELAKSLGLEKYEKDKVSNKIKELMNQSNSQNSQNGSNDSELPKTYNGKKILGYVIEP